MRFIEPSVKYWPQEAGIEGVWKQIARACRVSYQSTPRKGETDEEFVNRVIFAPAETYQVVGTDGTHIGDWYYNYNRLHGSVLEHGTVYLYDKAWNHSNLEKYRNNKYSRYYEVYVDKETCQDDTDYLCEFYVTTNLRVLIENNCLGDIKYICEPTEHHAKRYTFNVITDIGVTREFNRSRSMSICEQSTRYCDFTKSKFGGELTFIRPAWIESPIYPISDSTVAAYELMCTDSERAYRELRQRGWKPEQARQVLPLGLKTQAVYTAFEDDWKHFLALRADNVSGKSHPNMQFVANEIKRIAKEQKLWQDFDG